MIREIAQRLSDEVDELASVRMTASLEQITAGAQRHRLPTAIVHPIRDTARPNSLVNGVSQEVTHEIGVLLILLATAADAGTDLPDCVETMSAAIRAALVGWAPEEGGVPLELVRGEIVSIGNGTAWWLETYRTRSHLRSI